MNAQPALRCQCGDDDWLERSEQQAAAAAKKKVEEIEEQQRARRLQLAEEERNAQEIREEEERRTGGVEWTETYIAVGIDADKEIGADRVTLPPSALHALDFKGAMEQKGASNTTQQPRFHACAHKFTHCPRHVCTQTYPAMAHNNGEMMF